ncbi:MAG: tRNA epoxyqueuosine(34) reductase QueG [Verrucomicrobiota bacterium]|nr:tRNA epoxyqueuosine(34) reductase QueG [Verrucomicrobiota bacterium]
MKDRIVNFALELGFDACRVTSAENPLTASYFLQWLERGHHGEMAYLARNAHKRINPQQVLPGAQSIIVLAASYHHAQSSSLPSEATALFARYAQHADYHDALAAPLKKLADQINHLAGPNTRSLWYVDTGPLLERDIAQRAGLGFQGKHTNLISRQLGNWFFLAEIITTAAIEPDPAEKNRCGSCIRCITACPTAAITAPFTLDARRCISYLTIELKGSIPLELRPLIGNRIYGCDDCLAACPWNRFAQAGALMQSIFRHDLQSANLIELLSLDEAGFKEKFRGTPILRTKRRGLLRNVCVALGNVGNETALPALNRAASDSEPLIAEHARWAMDQISARLQTAPQNLSSSIP